MSEENQQKRSKSGSRRRRLRPRRRSQPQGPQVQVQGYLWRPDSGQIVLADPAKNFVPDRSSPLVPPEVVNPLHLESGLVIADLETGEAQTYDFGDNQAGRPLPAELYAATGEYLPYVERVEGTRRYRVRFLRRSDGQPAEDVTLPSSAQDGTFENLSTLVCRDGVLLVVTNHSVEAFGSLPPGEKLALE